MKAFATIALLATLGSAAFAQSYIASGSLTSTDPRFNRPTATSLSSNTAVAYDVYGFTVSVTGNYVAEMSSPLPLDGYLLIYTNAFNPTAPRTNLLNGDDDYSGAFTVLPGSSSTVGRGSRIATAGDNNFNAAGLPLVAGTTYYAVATSFNNATATGGVGDYTFGIGGGPGTVSALGTVPEPATMAALGFGALALLKRRRKSA